MCVILLSLESTIHEGMDFCLNSVCWVIQYMSQQLWELSQELEWNYEKICSWKIVSKD